MVCVCQSTRARYPHEMRGVLYIYGGKYAPRMPTTAIQRFLAPSPSPSPKPKPKEQGAAEMRQTQAQPMGLLGQFFLPTPVAVDHPTVASAEDRGGKEIHVARYGRIYKRKKHSAALGFKPPPCPEGHRYCRECGESRPESEFYTHIKRYICRKHHYQRVRASFIVRTAGDGGAPARNAEAAWLDLAHLCRLMGYDKVRYDRHDIMDLATNTKIPLSVRPRAVPIDPTQPMRPRNVAILQFTDLSLLVATYERTCSVALYMQLVQACNLVPRDADAGVPWDPYRDSAYRRVDYSIAEMAKKDDAAPREYPVVDAVADAALQEEDPLR